MQHRIASKDEWIEARKQLLVKEKELTRRRDELSEERRALPWVRVEKNEGSQTRVRWRSPLSRNLLIRSKSSTGECPSVSNGKSMMSFQSSAARNDSSGSVRTFVNSRSHDRLLPRQTCS